LRSIKYEDIDLTTYENPFELEEGLRDYIFSYNNDRPHQYLADATPEEVSSKKVILAA